jgi:hypothetical protein
MLTIWSAGYTQQSNDRQQADLTAAERRDDLYICLAPTFNGAHPNLSSDSKEK